jgi:outer membrane murein-binding lipoprotein Lpp
MVYVTSLIGCINLNVRKQEDMSRTEELNTKLRTLSYDHERLMSMHRVAIEKAANAEREMNLHKSRLE